MLKRPLTLLLLAAAALCGAAQTYGKMWQAAKTQAERDLPKSAIAEVKKIQARAVAERNDAQLLKAMLTLRMLGEEVAPDSGQAVVRQMEDALAREQRPVERALWQSALGQVYVGQNSGWFWNSRADSALLRRGCELLRQSVADTEVLAQASARSYLPLFVTGESFSDDLLSVLTRTAIKLDGAFSAAEADSLRLQQALRLEAGGNRAAALMFRLESNPGIDSLLRLKELYADLKLNVETYIALTQHYIPTQTRAQADSATALKLGWAREGIARYGSQKRANVLRNFIGQAEAPTMRLEQLGTGVAYPGDTVRFALEAYNVPTAEVRLYRTALTAREAMNLSSSALRAQARRLKPCAIVRHSFEAFRPNTILTDTVASVLTEAGVYIVEWGAKNMQSQLGTILCSRVAGMTFTYGGDSLRITAVDSRTGRPLTDGHLQVYHYNSANRETTLEQTCDADADGDFFLPVGGLNYRSQLFLTVGTDSYSPQLGTAVYGWRHQSLSPQTRQTIKLLTDRAIYRPGQEVQWSGFAYAQQGDSTWVVPNADYSVRLVDTNNREVGSARLRTDELGHISGTFSLPEVCLPGSFRLEASQLNTQQQTSISIRVEEYKRPTFSATLEEPAAPLTADTLHVGGTAQTLAGFAVQNARVAYTVRSSRGHFYGAPGFQHEQTGETTTDAEGRFSIPVALNHAKAGDNDELEPPHWNWQSGTDPRNRFYTYAIHADVTAGSGETQAAERTICLSEQGGFIEVQGMAETLCKERLPEVSIFLRTTPYNNTEENGLMDILRDGVVVATQPFATGTAFLPEALRPLPSGDYRLRISCGTLQLLTGSFTLLSETDTKPFSRNTFNFYCRRNEQGDSALVLAGTPEPDVTLFYDIAAQGRIVESRRIELSDTLLHFRLAYRPEYADGACVSFAFMRNHQLYAGSTVLIKPQPKKLLRAEWATFRSELEPGQREEWLLRITHADGTPANAALTATLYDAALDKLLPSGGNRWNFSIPFSRNYALSQWQSRAEHLLQLFSHGKTPFKNLNEPSLRLTQWDESLFRQYVYRSFANGTVRRLGARQTVSLAEVPVDYAANAPLAAAEAKAAYDSDIMYKSAATPEALAPSADTGETEAVQARSNFAETAFFIPALRTNGQGEVTLSFTLPESLTAWNFQALAHDAAVDYAYITGQVVARKKFMVETHLPRFVREGDRAVLPATLRNVSGEKVSGKVYCRIADAKTGRKVAESVLPFSIETGGETTVDFPFTASGGGTAYVCRITASGNGFSDGEERLLPVLADREGVVTAIPFALTEAGTTELRLDTIWGHSKQATAKRLTVEITSNPAWYAVAALPVLANEECLSAPSWATRYYAVSLARFIAKSHPEMQAALTAAQKGAVADNSWANVLQRNPELKQLLLAETPWVGAADTEAERAAQLSALFDEMQTAAKLTTALDKLTGLQNADGGWSWFPGMRSNAYISSDVAILLARQQVMTGNDATASCLRRGMDFLKREVSQMVKEMKRAEKGQRVSLPANELAYRYLYLRTLLNLGRDADVDYLLEKISRPDHDATMYGKALSALTLARFGRDKAAQLNLQSLLEHTVHKEGLGTYFDTDRALSGWSSYRIPTQAAAIEALLHFRNANDKTVEQMRLWLMQAKRTQLWPTSRATSDALFALLINGKTDGVVQPLDATAPVSYTLRRGKKILAVNAPSQAEAPQTTGHFCQTFADAPTLRADNIVLRKPSAGLTWGAVFAQYAVPASDVGAQGNGLWVERRLELKRGNTWVRLSDSDVVRKGATVRQVLTVQADRDFDFVSVKASRAASFEPREPLSGYCYRDGEWFYRVVRDASSEYFFEHFSKGRHIVTEEFYVDRSGTYHAGSARVQSQYTPEFTGTAPGFTLTSE